MELSELQKNQVIHIAILVTAVLFAFIIVKNQMSGVNSLKNDKKNEEQLNSALRELNELEQELKKYKKNLPKKDLSSIVRAIDAMAQKNNIQIGVLRPSQQEQAFAGVSGYSIYTCSLEMTSDDFHSFGKFVSDIESSSDVYLLENVFITPVNEEGKISVLASIQKVFSTSSK